MIEIKVQTEDGHFEIEEWDQVDGYVQISYHEEDIPAQTLPCLNKKEWRKLCKHVDHIFSVMEMESGE